MDDIIKQLGSYGLPGIIILVLGYAVRTLYYRNNEIQDKRIEENRETLKALHDTADALSGTTEAVKGLTEIIRAGGGR